MEDKWSPVGDMVVAGLVRKRVLVTGGLGWHGRWFIECLRQSGATVASAELADWGPERVPERDLSRPGVFERILDAGSFGAVVHFAGRTGRRFSMEDPAGFVRSNFLATMNVAQECARRNVRLLYASTSEIYGDHGDAAVDEATTPILPDNYDGATHLWAEQFCQVDQLPATALRILVPYGPGMKPGTGQAALPTFLWKAHHRQPIRVFTGATRPWCYITDTTRAIATVLASDFTGPAINIGSENSLEMVNVARLACEIAGAPEDLIDVVIPTGHYTRHKRHSMELLRGLGFQWHVDLEDGMRRMHDAVRSFPRDETLFADDR